MANRPVANGHRRVRPPQPEVRYFVVTVRCRDSADYKVAMTSETRLCQLTDAHCRGEGIDPANLKFFFNNDMLVDQTLTAREIGLRHNSVVHAMVRPPIGALGYRTWVRRTVQDYRRLRAEQRAAGIPRPEGSPPTPPITPPGSPP